jgi:hypothetical protein
MQKRRIGVKLEVAAISVPASVVRELVLTGADGSTINPRKCSAVGKSGDKFRPICRFLAPTAGSDSATKPGGSLLQETH